MAKKKTHQATAGKKIKLSSSKAIAIVPKPRTNYKGHFDIKPKRGIDWRTLKRDFMQHPSYMKPRSFLREIHGFTENQINSGYTIRNIHGWGQQKATMRQELLDESLDALRRTELERIPEVLKAKLNVIASYIQEAGSIDKLGRLSIMDRTFLLRALKTELGEPTTVGQHKVEIRPPSQEVPVEVAERLARDAIEA